MSNATFRYLEKKKEKIINPYQKTKLGIGLEQLVSTKSGKKPTSILE